MWNLCKLKQKPACAYNILLPKLYVLISVTIYSHQAVLSLYGNTCYSCITYFSNLKNTQDFKPHFQPNFNGLGYKGLTVVRITDFTIILTQYIKQFNIYKNRVIEELFYKHLITAFTHTDLYVHTDTNTYTQTYRHTHRHTDIHIVLIKHT